MVFRLSMELPAPTRLATHKAVLAAVSVVFTMIKEHYVSYNVMTAAAPGRLDDITSEFRFSAGYCLQGTRLRKDPDHPVQYWVQNGYHMFSAGYGAGSNKHAGVLTALATKRHRRNNIVA
eukprot:TRINITY_DN115461_c0_g1_i1.p1 TRINITY_DN115461_c0_g1~~TRINITY_DN115461_c0_g1_i1.p1  ORF type:complete len:120 (+),score=12.04 TRINITY_DN115461_c0_g1_i1:25-384(+)